MKLIYHACLLPLFFVSCQGMDVGGAVRDGIKAGVEAADRNHDGVLTNQEIKDSKNDPMFWTAIGGALLGLLGLNGARRAQRDTDELYDKISNKPA